MESPDGYWSCTACTYLNLPSTKDACEICLTQRSSKRVKYDRKNEIPLVEPGFDYQEFVCPYCNNDFSTPELLEEHVAVHQMESEGGFGSSEAPSGGYNEQYEKSIMRAAKDGRVSEKWAKEKLSEMKSRDPRAEDIETRTQGICLLLVNFFAKNKGTSAAQGRHVVVATNVDFYSASYGDRGWGCGYRNIQMMCSSLLQIPALKKRLFGGMGHIPTVPCVQEFLEAAWSEGFDAEGAGQLGSSVFGTRKWIGTTECVTLLRSFNIRAEIVDFVSATATEAPTTKKGKQQSITAFVTGSSSHSSNKSEPNDTKKKYKPNRELFDWIVAHFEEQANLNELTGAPILPVYLQHFGHSRTVIGFERTKGSQINLLIFDPSIWGKNIPSDIAAGKLQKLRRTLQSFTHKEYQVAFVQDPDSLLTEQERERSKRMSALRRIISK